MPHGQSSRRSPLGLAWIALPAALAVGCQRPVVQRLEPLPTLPAGLPDRPQSPSPVPTTVTKPAPEPPAPKTAEAEPASASAPTPLLDALVRRAVAVEQAGIEAPDGSDPKEPQADGDDPGPKPRTLVPKAPPRSDDAPAPAEPPALKEPASALPTPPGGSATPTIHPDRPADPPRPRDIWADGLGSLRQYAHGREGDADGTGDLWALRARLLDWMAEPIADDPGARLWRTVLAPLARAGSTDEHARAAEVRAAVEALEDLEPLEITDLRLCRKVSGFGSYEPLSASSCKAGRPLILYCELSGVRYKPTGDGYRSRLAAHVEVRSAGDGKSAWTHALGTAEDLCHRRRRDYFVPYRITLPASLPPGRYELRLTQTDLISDRTTTLSLPVTVHP